MNSITLEIQGWDFDYPGTSCKNILDSGFSKGDGEYWINPGWSGDPLKVYCDMTTDGGEDQELSSFPIFLRRRFKSLLLRLRFSAHTMEALY